MPSKVRMESSADIYVYLIKASSYYHLKRKIMAGVRFRCSVVFDHDGEMG